MSTLLPGGIGAVPGLPGDALPVPAPEVVPVPAPADPVPLAPPLVGGIEVARTIRGAASVRAAMHGFKAWASVRARLEPESVRAARAAGERWALSYDEYVGVLRRIGEIARLRRRVADVEDAIEYLYALVRDLALLPPMLPTAPRRQPRVRPGLGWSPYVGEEEETREQLPPELLEALMGILGRLTAEFLEQLQGVGADMAAVLSPRPTPIPRRRPGPGDPGAGPPGVVPPGWEATSFGSTEGVAFQVGVGASLTDTSGPMVGPAVVERISVYSENEFAGTVQLKVAGSGVVYPSTAEARNVFGDALVLANAAAGRLSTEVPWDAFNVFAEWWPRRVVRLGSWRLVFTARNTGAAPAWIAATLDTRVMRPVP